MRNIRKIIQDKQDYARSLEIASDKDTPPKRYKKLQEARASGSGRPGRQSWLHMGTSTSSSVKWV